MGTAWVAGVTRAKAMLSRYLAAHRAEDVAMARSLDEALRYLARASATWHHLDPGGSLAQSQRAVGATLLWQLRILSGWQPRSGSAMLRLLASGFEIANTEDHLRTLTGAETAQLARPYHVGALATAWPRLAQTRSPRELRGVLEASAWGDPGAESAAAVATGIRIRAAQRTADTVPEAGRWAAGRLALLVGREMFVSGRRMTGSSTGWAARVIGHQATQARTFSDFRRALPVKARWVVDGIDDPADLWRAEARWWAQLDRDGRELVRRSSLDSAPVVGAVAVLCSDAWRVRAALELAARGGGRLEGFDAEP